MDLPLIVTVAWFGFAVTLLACMHWRGTVSRTKYEAALRQIEQQQATIDRLLSRNFERVTGEDAKRFEREFGKLAGQWPTDKPE